MQIEFLGKVATSISFVDQRLQQIQNLHFNHNIIMNSITQKDQYHEDIADSNPTLKIAFNTATAIVNSHFNGFI